LVPFGLLVSGYLQAGGLVVIGIVTFTITLLAVLGQGIHDIAMLGFPVIITVASLALRRRLFFLSCGLVLGAVAWLVFGEGLGWFKAKPNQIPGLLDFMLIAAILLVCILVVDLLAENMRSSMFRARSEIGRRQLMESQLRHQSSHDGLTGVYNRFYFEQELARLEREQEYPVSVIVADVDDLKVVNDTRGHVAGDQMLVQSAQALRTTFRSEDVVARIGGDEYAVLLPRTDMDTARSLLARVRSKLAEQNTASPDLQAQLSLGTATASQGKLIETFNQADRAMYADKAVRKLKRIQQAST
jgi:diguanylate cyclase (GGDEF)-like protein